MQSNWVPIDYAVTEDTHIRKLLNSDQHWQLYESEGQTRTLVLTEWLSDQLLKSKLVNASWLISLKFDTQEYFAIHSNVYRLAPVSELKEPITKCDALGFAKSMKATRNIESKASLHDSIYVERYSRLLPTWTLTDRKEDEWVLGRWLTRGVKIPITSNQKNIISLGMVGRR